MDDEVERVIAHRCENMQDLTDRLTGKVIHFSDHICSHGCLKNLTSWSACQGEGPSRRIPKVAGHSSVNGDLQQAICDEAAADAQIRHY